MDEYRLFGGFLSVVAKSQEEAPVGVAVGGNDSDREAA
jgi:hypothetical protein